jgi:hypothetical protein
MSKEFKPNFQILSFQRSGSSFLREYILQKTNAGCYSTHSEHTAEDLPIITILRKPEDSFRSWLSMHRFYQAKEPSIDTITKLYLSMHNYAMINEAVFINFDDLVKSPDKILIHIATKFNLSINEVEYKNNLIDKTHLNHLSSSASVPGYNEIKFLEKDIKVCNDLYNNLLLKCIEV